MLVLQRESIPQTHIVSHHSPPIRTCMKWHKRVARVRDGAFAGWQGSGSRLWGGAVHLQDLGHCRRARQHDNLRRMAGVSAPPHAAVATRALRCNRGRVEVHSARATPCAACPLASAQAAAGAHTHTHQAVAREQIPLRHQHLSQRHGDVETEHASQLARVRRWRAVLRGEGRPLKIRLGLQQSRCPMRHRRKRGADDSAEHKDWTHHAAWRRRWGDRRRSLFLGFLGPCGVWATRARQHTTGQQDNRGRLAT